MELRLLLELQVLLPDSFQLPNGPHGDQRCVLLGHDQQLRHRLCASRHIQQRSLLVQCCLRHLHPGESGHVLHRFASAVRRPAWALMMMRRPELPVTVVHGLQHVPRVQYWLCHLPVQQPVLVSRSGATARAYNNSLHRAVANCQTLSASNCALCGTCRPGYTLCAATGTCYLTGLMRAVHCRRRDMRADANCMSRSSSGLCPCLACNSPYTVCPSNNGLCTIGSLPLQCCCRVI